MVRPHSQHECSSPVICSFKFSACRVMDASGAEFTASLAAPTGAAHNERDSGELEPALATPRGAEPPASGSTPASAETVLESPSGVRHSSREPTTRRGSRYPGNDPGKDLLNEISALKEQQKKAREENRRSRRSCEMPIVVARG